MSLSVTAPAARSVRIDDWSDRLNPVVVREVRQALKSRGFVTVFNLLLLACWATSVLGLAITGPGLDFGRPAMAFFSVYFVSLCFAVGVVIPLQACESVWAERRDGTLEVLTVTSLRTGRVVAGKFAAAATKAALIYAAVGPF
ncbi:MAG: ABC transporter permease, partial [Planctomycetota bacterium]